MTRDWLFSTGSEGGRMLTSAQALKKNIIIFYLKNNVRSLISDIVFGEIHKVLGYNPG